MGALLGRTTPIQLLLMGLIEILVFAGNEYLQLEIFKVCGEILQIDFDAIEKLYFQKNAYRLQMQVVPLLFMLLVLILV